MSKQDYIMQGRNEGIAFCDKIVKEKGFSKFSINKHTEIWKEYDAKNTKKKYGVMVVKTWYWYQNWLDFVLDYCEKHKEKYC